MRIAGFAGIAALTGWGLMSVLTGAPGADMALDTQPEGAVSSYQPGGLALHEVRHTLAARAQEIDGCVGLAEFDEARLGAPPPPAGSLARVVQVLTKSETARAIMNRIRGRSIHVCLDAETDLLAYYFSSINVIGVSKRLAEGGRVAFLAHELGHVPQHPRYSDNRYFAPRDLLLLRRVREAAAEALACRIAWELRAAGYPGAWREKTASPYADVARAFAALARRDSGPDGLLAATRAAFDRWFAARWRRNAYDRMTLEHLGRISRDEVGLVPPRRQLTAGFLAGIASLNGNNFLAETRGPPLTGAYYAGRISNRAAARLRRIMDDAGLTVSWPSRPVAPGADAGTRPM